MDVNSQIVAKRAAAGQVRQSADRMSGDYMIQALVFAAELEIQADVLEHRLLAPTLTLNVRLRAQESPCR